MKESMVAVGSHKLARAQAKSFAEQARALAVKGARIGHPDKYGVIGDQIAFLVSGALSLELYLKSFMVMARGGRVTFGHNLAELYAQFPQFLKDEFERDFKNRVPPDAQYHIIALRPSPTAPEPPEGDGPGLRFTTFAETLESLATAFTKYRYFFENISSDSWVFLPFPDKALVAALESVEQAYAAFEQGKLSCKGAGP